MKLIRLFLLLCIASSASYAQSEWQIHSSINTASSHYDESLIMNNQHAQGIRISGEKDKAWGLAIGLQKVDIKMLSGTQSQDNWFLSNYVHIPSTTLPGRWTMQLDAHKLTNDAKQGNNRVQVVATQITWLSYTLPLKADFSFASSNYQTTSNIHQYSSALAYGLNGQNDWIQVRGYSINHLNPDAAFGKSNAHATDVKFTHFLQNNAPLTPTSMTIGIERGKRIYGVDMTTQTVYNLPMLNEGGENIAASWKLSSNTDFNIQLSKNRYYSEFIMAHRFTLTTLSAQLNTNW